MIGNFTTPVAYKGENGQWNLFLYKYTTDDTAPDTPQTLG